MLTWGILLLAAVTPASASWSPLGGGPVEPVINLRLHPAKPQLLYARVSEDTFEAYLWRSRDGGATWRDVQSGLLHPTTALALDPADPERIWVWTPDGQLWHSGDAGETWILLFATPHDQVLPDVRQLLVDRGLIYRVESEASGAGGTRVDVSRDGGASFRAGASVLHFFGTEGIFVHPVRGELVAFSAKGLEVSADQGATWSLRGTYRSGFAGGRFAPSSPDVYYGLPLRVQGTLDECLARSDDAGAHWVASARPRLPFGSSLCYDVAIDPRDSRHVWVAAVTFTSEGSGRLLFESRDAGASWSPPRGMPGTGVVAPGGDVVYTAGTYAGGIQGRGLYLSEDGGRTWQAKHQGIANGDLRRGFVAQRLPSGGAGRRLNALQTPPGDSPAALVRSDGGKGWVKSLNRPGSLADAGRPFLVAVDEHGAVVRSQNGGETWSAVASAPLNPLSLCSSLGQPRFVSLEAFEDVGASGRVAFWTSDDAGSTWRRTSRGLPINCNHAISVDWCPTYPAYAVDPFNTRRRWVAIAGGFFVQTGLFLSENGGGSWHTASTELSEIFALAADPKVEDRLLAGTFTGLFLSEDGGRHWRAFGDGLPEGDGVRQLAWDPRAATWYAATSSQGIFRSLDNGFTWSLLAGAPDHDAPAIAVDPRLPTALLAAFRGQGAWRWTPSTEEGR